MGRLTAAHVSGLCDGADPSTVTVLIASKRDLHEVVGLEVCIKLTRLDLSDNKLSSIEGLALCSNLRWLSLSANLLTSLSGVENLLQLRVLNVSRNQLTSLAGVTVLTELRALILNDNLITSIGRLENLRHLTTLVLSNNPIRELGNFADMLVSLTKLSMSHCQVKALGASLKRCVALREVRFAHNNLSLLPKELERNRQLQVLDLGNNKLHNWADLQVLESIKSLRSLNLKGNSLCSQANYTSEVLKLLPNLRTLDGQPVDGRGKNVKEICPPQVSEVKAQDKAESLFVDASSKSKKRKTVHGSPDSGSKPFIDLITDSQQSGFSFSADGMDAIVSETLQDPKVERKRPSGKRSQVGQGPLTKVTEALAVSEIGMGGSSTWDTGFSEVTESSNSGLNRSESSHSGLNRGESSNSGLNRSAQPVYSRWNFKVSQG